MSDTTSGGTNTKKKSRTRKKSPALEEASSDGSSSGEVLLKKGPWLASEDAILREYVNTYGGGNWNAVRKHTGLQRCGKSCRLRWANHLRPDLKKNPITPEEQALIIELHDRWGNKWSRIALELPGRTDNEIKNYWNTRLKRLQRVGEPEIAQALDKSPRTQESALKQEENLADASQLNDFDIPDIDFSYLVRNQSFLNYLPKLPDIPASYSFDGGVNSWHSSGFTFSPRLPHKRHREVETRFPSSSGSIGNIFFSYELQEDDAYPNLSVPFQPSYDYYADLLHGSHASINGNASSSEPTPVALKTELPSLQYSTTYGGSWTAPSSPPLPSLESVDATIQSPLSDPTWSSPLSSGLLDAVVYESRLLKMPKKDCHPQISEMGDLVESSSQNFVFKGETCELISPLGHTTASAFLEHTVTGSSPDDPWSTEAKPGSIANVEAVGAESNWENNTAASFSELEYMRPDVLLDSFGLGQRTAPDLSDQSMAFDVGQFLNDDISCC